MRKLIYLFLIAIPAMFISCSKEYLEITPQGELNEHTLANLQGVEASLMAAYSMLDGWSNDWENHSPPWAAAGSNWIWGSVASDDSYKGSKPGDQDEITAIERYQWSPDDLYLDVKFRALYEGISRANTAMNLLLNATDINEENRERLEGEIRFLRAHYHFEAWKMWGNVPVFDETDDDFRKTNTSDPVGFIQNDLQTAVQYLPETQADPGRATQGAARSYLGKLLLYTRDYVSAKTYLDEVVNSQQYELAPCFHDPFSQTGENGKEMIFSIQASVNDGTAGGENGNFPELLNFPDYGSPFGCCGFHQPSQNLVNAFRVNGHGIPYLDNFNDTDLSSMDLSDPRLDWTVGRDNVPYLDWGIHDSTWIKNPAWAGPFSPKKFVHYQGEQSQVGWAPRQLGPVNIPIIRYADVLLMLAECEVELGNLERARELVNMIRVRADECAQGPGKAHVKPNDPIITWANYRVNRYPDPWADQEFARKAVRMERRLELALEGHRLFDLRRWGVAEMILNDYLQVEATRRTYLVEAHTFEAKHHLFPLPSNQIEQSKVDGIPQLVQNPGW